MSTSDSCPTDPAVPMISGEINIHNNKDKDAVREVLKQTDKNSHAANWERSPKAIDFKENISLNADKTQIQQFYTKQIIFITGSCFLEKMLIQKLLRACTDISTIYVLIHSKDGKNVEDRLNDIFENVIFDQLKAEVPDFRSKIVPIKGDLCAKKLRLSYHDENLLKQNVSIVFHTGETVRFNKELKTAAMINVNATKYILNMAKNMTNLKAFIHVSTIYANCHLQHNGEIFYPYHMTSRAFLTTAKNLDPGEVSEQIAVRFSKWPNTYTITKAIAESLLRDACAELPVGMFRPGLVISPADEPLVGWTDNDYGPMKLVTNFYKGMLKYIWCDPNCIANLVPVDKTVNALIVAAWDVSSKPRRRGIETLIYNYESSNNMPVTWGQYFHTAKVIAKRYPMEQCTQTLKLMKRNISLKTYFWFGQTLPAILKDKWKQDANKQSLREQYDILYKTVETFGYFMTRTWTYTNYNVQSMWHKLDRKDQRLFNFDMKEFNWQKYLEDHFKGILIYLFKEDLDTLKANCKKLKTKKSLCNSTKKFLLKTKGH